MAEWATETIEANGYALRVQTSGAGSPVVVLDDALGPYGPGAFVDALARTHEVAVPLHPGMGGAPIPEWLDNVSDLANFYLDVLDAADRTGLHLVGCGLGGWIAADLATRNGARLNSLSLIAPGGLALKNVPQCDIFLGGDDDVLRKLIHEPGIADRVIAETLTPESEDVRLQNQQFGARLMWQPRLHDPHLAKWLHRIKTPTLIVWGADDALYPMAYAHAWQGAIAGSKLEIIKACGHLPQVERPALAAGHVTNFIASQAVRP